MYVRMIAINEFYDLHLSLTFSLQDHLALMMELLGTMPRKVWMESIHFQTF